jgi:hypothetical protein
MTMTIKKTSIAVEEKTWQKWLTYSIRKSGSARKASDLLNSAMEEYMENHPLEE